MAIKITETFHHSPAYSVQSVECDTVTLEALNELLEKSYYKEMAEDTRLRIVDELRESGVAEFGWATYEI